jgi:hypothetical protein
MIDNDFFSETADYYNKKLGSDGRVVVASSVKKARLFQDFPESRTGLAGSQAHCGRRLKFDASLDG